MRHAPVAETGRCAIVVPPFAEELNKSRRMLSLLGAQLAADGAAVWRPDLFGTGESDGEFADARWEGWLEDLGTTIQAARAEGARHVSLWALRLGALLVLDFLRRRPLPELGQLVLWHPVVSGTQNMTQFLRLRLAANMRGSAEPGENTASLRARLARGEPLEVAGYQLAPALVAAIDALELEALALAARRPFVWLDVAASDADGASVTTTRVARKLADAGLSVEVGVAPGPAFWATTELTINTALLEQSQRINVGALAR